MEKEKKKVVEIDISYNFPYFELKSVTERQGKTHISKQSPPNHLLQAHLVSSLIYMCEIEVVVKYFISYMYIYISTSIKSIYSFLIDIEKYQSGKFFYIFYIHKGVLATSYYTRRPWNFFQRSYIVLKT